MKDIKWEDAPEWADRLMECRFVKYWCSVERFTEAGLNKDSDLFKIGGVTIGDLSLIEMRPKQQEDNAEWVPAGRCVHIYGGGVATRQEEDVTIVGIDKDGNYVFQNDKSTCYYSDPAIEFRPLKTDEQKKREAFYLAVVDACMPIHSDDFNIDEIAGALRHAGFTAPEGGE